MKRRYLAVVAVFPLLGFLFLSSVPLALAGTGSMSTAQCVQAVGYAFPANGTSIFNLNMTNWNGGNDIHVYNASGSASASYTYLSIIDRYANASKGNFTVIGKHVTNYTVFADVEGFQTSHRSASVNRLVLNFLVNGSKASWLHMNGVSLTLSKSNATSFKAALSSKHLDGFLAKQPSSSSDDPLRIIEGIHFVFDDFRATLTFNCATGGYSYSISASSSPASAGMMAIQAFLKELHA